MVHALPVAVTLRARLPGARLTWIVERRESAVLAGHPALDEVVIVDTHRWRRLTGAAQTLRELRALREQLRARRFDVAFDLQGLLKSGLLVALTGARLRVGFAPAGIREPLSALFTNRRLAPPATARHIVEQYLALLGALDIREPVVDFQLPADAGAEARMDEFFASVGLKPRDVVVVLNPGAGRADKRWPVERFCALAGRLADEKAVTVLVAWGPGEEPLARAIVEGVGPPRALLAPPTDVAELVALLRRAGATVSGDSGPLHLAAAVGSPCVGLYRPSATTWNDAGRNGPWGTRHRVVQSPDGSVGSIAVDEVFRAVSEVLA